MVILLRNMSFWLSTFAALTLCGWAASSPLPKEVTIDLGEGMTMEFVLVPAGSFWMGSHQEIGDADETPRHEVVLSRAYYFGKYEVTQEQWQKIMGENPSAFKGGKHPVDSVSWDACQVFLKKLREKTGRRFTLPTEAQWEYACRAGTTTRWNFGDDEKQAGDSAWLEVNSEGKTHPVGQKKPNAWGFYDLHGNVWEWCSDWYARPYPNHQVTDPHYPGPQPETSPVLRGGGWGEHPLNARSAYRNCNGASNGHNGTGFRCVLEIASNSIESQ